MALYSMILDWDAGTSAQHWGTNIPFLLRLRIGLRSPGFLDSSLLCALVDWDYADQSIDTSFHSACQLRFVSGLRSSSSSPH
jgi:hypothetical protein